MNWNYEIINFKSLMVPDHYIYLQSRLKNGIGSSFVPAIEGTTVLINIEHYDSNTWLQYMA